MRITADLAALDAATYADPAQVLAGLIETADLDQDTRARISARAAELVRSIRDTTDPGMMEVFLAQYSVAGARCRYD